MPSPQRRRERPALDAAKLDELALAYVARFATTRAKLGSYLRRKVCERGWAEAAEAPVDAIVERLSAAGYIDDAAYALAKSRALTARGYGGGRVRQSLRAAGVGDEDLAPAAHHAEAAAVEAAVKFARRRRIGPFAAAIGDRRERERAIAAMVRAGHSYALSRAMVDQCPAGEPDREQLAAAAGQVAPNN